MTPQAGDRLAEIRALFADDLPWGLGVEHEAWLIARVEHLEAALRRTEIALQSIAGNASDASTRLVAMATINDFRNAVVSDTLPTAADLTGSDPDFTAGLTTQEHMDQIRGVRSDQSREQGD